MDYDEAWQKFGLRWQELAIISGVVAGYTDRENRYAVKSSRSS